MRIISLFSFCLCFSCLYGQNLRPGFDSREYMQLMKLIDYQNRVFDTGGGKKSYPIPEEYSLVFSSPELGLKNQWDGWIREDKTLVIVLRGTIPNGASWLANFYAAMIPANGSLQLNDSLIFKYRLAADERASVHVGWTTALGHLAPSIEKEVMNAYKKGTRSVIVCGHSQGGALAFLTRSYLEYAPGIPKDIRFKAYCSAAPKPGNIYYAYDFDFITRGGMAYRVVSDADWVPETPFTIQTLRDINEINPFMDVDKALRQQSWLVRIYLKSKYRKMDKVTTRAAKRYRKTLGSFVYGQVKKVLPQFREPDYAPSMQYMTAGNPVILRTDSGYYARHPFNGKNIFVHHLPKPYIELVQQHYPESVED